VLAAGQRRIHHLKEDNPHLDMCTCFHTYLYSCLISKHSFLSIAHIFWYFISILCSAVFPINPEIHLKYLTTTNIHILIHQYYLWRQTCKDKKANLLCLCPLWLFKIHTYNEIRCNTRPLLLTRSKDRTNTQRRKCSSWFLIRIMNTEQNNKQQRKEKPVLCGTKHWHRK
jgi:hypothetical protein